MARLTEHNVVATLPNLEDARDVLSDLNQAGIDADDISLLGKHAQEVAHDPDTRLRDSEAVSEVGQKAAGTAGAGAVLGGVVGAAAFLIPGVGPVVGAGIWGAVAGGAIAGGVVGGMAGAITAIELGPEWEATYGDSLREGRVLVAVHARDEQEAAKAEKVFDKAKVHVEHVNESGQPVSTGRN